MLPPSTSLEAVRENSQPVSASPISSSLHTTSVTTLFRCTGSSYKPEKSILQINTYKQALATWLLPLKCSVRTVKVCSTSTYNLPPFPHFSVRKRSRLLTWAVLQITFYSDIMSYPTDCIFSHPLIFKALFVQFIDMNRVAIWIIREVNTQLSRMDSISQARLECSVQGKRHHILSWAFP